jgi:hypothetical protein
VAIDRQQLPGAGHATQLDAAAFLEAGARADDQVTHGARDQDFTGAGLPEDPRRDVDGNPADAQDLCMPGTIFGMKSLRLICDRKWTRLVNPPRQVLIGVMVTPV